MTKYYIAYGSNLNIKQMAFRCPKAKAIGKGELKDWRLMFRGSKTGAYLTIEKSKDSRVPVGIWEVTKADEAALDCYEGYPTFYRKENFKLPIELFDSGEIQTVEAFAYIMDESRPIGVPSYRYLDVCAKGYHDFGFFTDWLEAAYERAECEVNNRWLAMKEYAQFVE